MKSKEWFDEDEIVWIKMNVWQSKSHLEENEFREYEMLQMMWKGLRGVG